MKSLKSNSNLNKYKYIKTTLGDVYLHKNYVVTEFKEGVHINFDDFSEIAELVNIHYKNEPIGFISNRIHAYSINLNDAPLYNKTFSNLKAYAVVAYKPLTKSVFEIENHFFEFNRKAFKSLTEAKEWIESELLKVV